MGSTGGSLSNVGYYFLGRAGVMAHCQSTSSRRTLPHVNTSSYQVASVKRMTGALRGPEVPRRRYTSRLEDWANTGC
eukprot:1525896-Prymnesium_polylepis.1